MFQSVKAKIGEGRPPRRFCAFASCDAIRAFAMTGGALTEDLTRRQRALLLATVREFIVTAEPVGSHQIAARYSLGVRAAMVRNIMGELEETGYLYQPHTSAGRVPSDKAFRYYVDHLMPFKRIAFGDRAQIELHCSGHSGDMNELVRETSRLLALLTGQAALVMAPRLEAMVLERVNFVRLRERTVLAVFVAAAGGVQNRVVQTDHDHTQEELERMARFLNESLHGRTLEEARAWIEERLTEERMNYDRFVRTALALGGELAQHIAHPELYVEGSAKALEQPEFADHNKLKGLLRALEDKTALLELLERSLNDGSPIVSIGGENFDTRLSDFSVVAAPYSSGSMPLGSLAIVGPVRMDYERVIPLVGYAAKTLSRVLVT
jgi:heat-inducible transcriptional repressor